jgi:hypothetical protein
MMNMGTSAVKRNAGNPLTGQPMVNNKPDKHDSSIKWIFFIKISNVGGTKILN